MIDSGIVGPANSTESRIGDAIELMKSGKGLGDIEDAVIPDDESDHVVTPDDLEPVTQIGEEATGGTDQGNEPSSEGSDPSNDPSDPETVSASDLREVKITDDKGKRTIKVDFNDHDRMEKFVKQAAGFRKHQAERDRAIAERDKFKGFEEKHDLFNSLEEAYEVGGIDQVLETLVGEEEASTWLSQKLEDQTLRQHATPEELAALAARDKSTRLEREMAQIRRDNEKQAKALQAKAEQAEVAELMGMATPAFNKHRFEGTLGDAVLEHKIDQAIWSSAMESLAALEEQGVNLTQSSVNKAVKEAASVYRKFANKQVSKRTDQIIDRKKQSATKNAQAAVSKSMGNTKNNEAAYSKLRSGDIAGFIRGFNGKIKM